MIGVVANSDWPNAAIGIAGIVAVVVMFIYFLR